MGHRLSSEASSWEPDKQLAESQLDRYSHFFIGFHFLTLTMALGFLEITYNFLIILSLKFGWFLWVLPIFI